jgi:hypothetical protein
VKKHWIENLSDAMEMPITAFFMDEQEPLSLIVGLNVEPWIIPNPAFDGATK